MKTKTSQTTRKTKWLRFGAGALLLCVLFVFVFAGVLSASFAVEEKQIELGQLDANVADASVPTPWMASTNGWYWSFDSLAANDFYHPAYSKGPFYYFTSNRHTGFGSVNKGGENSEFYDYLKLSIDLNIVYAVKNGHQIDLTFYTECYEADEYGVDNQDDRGICILPAKHEPSDANKWTYLDCQNSAWQTQDPEGAFSAFNDDDSSFSATLSLTEDKITGSDGNYYVWLAFAVCSDSEENFIFNNIRCTLKMKNSIKATFQSGANGSISPSGEVTFNNTEEYEGYNGAVEVTATANRGYHFSNWSHNYSGTIYGLDSNWAATNPYKFQAYAVRPNTTFTANFAGNTYAVSYNLDGGTHGSTHPESGIYDTSFYVSAPSKTGYQFAGWIVSSGLDTSNESTAQWSTNNSSWTNVSSASTVCVNGATGNVYFKNLTPTQGAPITITATWTANTGTIVYNANADSGVTGLPSNQPYNWETATASLHLSTTIPSRPGYIFRGWATYGHRDSGEPDYAPNASFSTSSGEFDITTTTTITRTLYAVWTPISFTVNGNDRVALWNNQNLQVLETRTGSAYITPYNYNNGGDSNLVSPPTISAISDFSDTYYGSIAFTGTASSTTRPTEKGSYGATITVWVRNSQNNNTIENRGSVTFSFAVVEGDFYRADKVAKWGTESNPYVIRTIEHLVNLAQIVNGTKRPLNSVGGINDTSPSDVVATKVSGAITYSGCYFKLEPTVLASQLDVAPSDGFVPIGNSGSHYFAGNFDGNGKTVRFTSTGLSGTAQVGLFGYVSGSASIHDIEISGIVSGSGDYVGGLVGYMANGTVYAVKNLASVTGAQYVGGIVGQMNGSANVHNCYNIGTVTANTSAAGGIAGRVASGTLQYTANYGSVTGASAGSVLGSYGSSTISYNYSLTGKDIVGSFTGTGFDKGYNVSFFAPSESFVLNKNFTKVVVPDRSKVLPYVNATLVSDWANIVSYNINGFSVEVSEINQGEFFSSGTSNVASGVGAQNNRKPADIITPWNSSDKKVVARYEATNLEVGSYNTIYVSKKAIKMATTFDDGANFAENNSDSSFYNDYNGLRQGWVLLGAAQTPAPPTYPNDYVAIVIGPNSYTITNTYTGRNSTSYSATSTRPLNAGDYDYVGQIAFEYSGTAKLVGQIARTFTISKRALTSAHTWSDDLQAGTKDRSSSNTFIFNGASQGLNTITISYNNVEQSRLDQVTINSSNKYEAITKDGLTWFGVLGGTDGGRGTFQAINHNTTVSAVGNTVYRYTLTLADSNNYTIDGGASVTYQFVIARLNLNTDFNIGYLHFGYAGEKVSNDTMTTVSSTHYHQLNTFAGNVAVGQSGYAAAFETFNANPSMVYGEEESHYDVSHFKLFLGSSGAGVSPSNWVQYDMAGNFNLYNVEMVGGDVTVTQNVLPQADDTAPLKNATVRIDGLGNFDGSLTVFYKLMKTDFDGKVIGGNKGYLVDNWGTPSNPFVISDVAYLIRLAQIVNGSEIWNSVRSQNPKVSSAITDRNYANAYFELSTDIVITTAGGFKPIGNDADHYFSGTFNGNDGVAQHTIALFDVSEEGHDYVGLFGHVFGVSRDNPANITNLRVTTSNLLTPPTFGEIKGANYVGSIAGFARNANIQDCASTAFITATGNWVGGLVGYGENVHIINSTYTPSGTADDRTLADYLTTTTLTGARYVGGLAGELTGYSNIDVDTSGVATGQSRVDAQIYGTDYVGGYVGRFETLEAINVTPLIRRTPNTENDIGSGPSYSNANVNHVVGTNYVGGVFGFVKGGNGSKINIARNGSSNPYIYTRVMAAANGNVIGGLVGYANSVEIVLTANISTANFFRPAGNPASTYGVFVNFATNGTTNYFGGLVGILGEKANITSYNTENLTTGYAANLETTLNGNVGSYVGGAVGYVSTKAGEVIDANTSVFGNKIKLTNKQAISAKGDYVGGVVGYIGIDATLFGGSGFDDISADAGAANNQKIVFAPRYTYSNGTTTDGAARNTYSVKTTGSYVGGIVGIAVFSDTESNQKGARLEFVNERLANATDITLNNVAVFNVATNGSDFNDNFGSGLETVKGTNYVGGIVGYIKGRANTSKLAYVFATANTAALGISGTNYVGGLVGAMDNGDIDNCFFSRFDASITGPYNTTHVSGTSNVGGLIGHMEAGEVRESVGFGFLHSNNNASRSGVVGSVETGVKVTNSWAVYYVANNTYNNTIDTARGKGIIIDNNATMNKVPNYKEIAQMVGLVTSSASLGSATTGLAGENGSLSIGLQLLDASQVKQLVFYRADGSDDTYDMSVFADDSATQYTGTKTSKPSVAIVANEVLYLRLEMVESSISVCLKDVTFKNVPTFDSSNPPAGVTAKSNLESAYRAPSGDDNYYPVATSATYDSNHYIHSATAVIMLDLGNGKSIKVGYFNKDYSSFGGEDNPYIISTTADWNAFAANIRNGRSTEDADYNSKYFVLTADLNLGTISSFAGLTSGSTNVFKGVFDGDGHTITFNYSDSGQNNAGLFPDAADATFLNLTVAGTINVAGSVGTSTSTSDKYSGSDNVQRYYSSSGNKPYNIWGTTNGQRAAGFVGYPSGDVTFVNCTNKVNVTAISDAGGFVGASKQGITVTIIDCVNDGNIFTYQAGSPYDSQSEVSTTDTTVNWPHGTGGFIGNADGTSVLDSCKNNGNVSGGQNVGGVVGRTTQSLEIYNSANTGNILAHSGYDGESTGYPSDAKEQSGTRNWLSYAGGILGKSSKYGSSASAKAGAVKIYASYNNGTITAYGNIAGGIVGSVGDLYPAIRGVSQELLDEWVWPFDALAKAIGGSGNNADKTSAAGDSVISYCYNTGVVQTGGTRKKKAEAWGAKRNAMMGGTIAGGIAGIFGAGTVSYCYNTGDINSWGIDGFSFEWHVRVGGIVAQAQPTKPASGDAYAIIHHCYNLGLVSSKVGSGSSEFSGGITILDATNLNNGTVMYGAQILGYIEDPAYEYAKSHTSVTDCYSLSGKYNNANYSNPSSRDYGIDACDYEAQVGAIGLYVHVVYLKPNVHNCSSGIVCSLDEYTAVMNSDGIIAPSGKFVSGGTAYNVSNPKGNSSGETITYSGNGRESGAGTLVKSNGADIKSFNEETYTPTYSNDTGFKSGTAFGWVYEYGSLPQLAVFALGTRKGMSMLATSYGRNSDGDFVAQQAGGKYSPYIVKDGTHLLGMTALTSATKNSIYYTFENKYIEVVDANNNINGDVVKSIALPTSTDKTIAYYGYSNADGTGTKVGSKTHFLFSDSDVYNSAWNNKNHYPTSSDWTSTGDALSTVNLYSLSGIRSGGVFKGSFDGKGVTLLNLKMQWLSNGGLDLGLFGNTENATIKNIKIGGTINAYTKGNTESNVVALGGIVGRAGAGTTIEGCEVGTTSQKAQITAYSVAASGNMNPQSYVGGVAGVAIPSASKSVDLKNNKVVNADVTTFKMGAGGMLGGAIGSEGLVNINGGEVLGATIGATNVSSSTNDSLGTNIGGIIGVGDDDIDVYVKGVSVGDKTKLTPQSTKKVTINGENTLGGVIGTPSKKFYMENIGVYGDVLINRTKFGTTAKNVDTFGTAIGGFVGYTPNDETANIEFRGSLIFAGTIKTTDNTTSGMIQNIGGLAGYIGAGTKFEIASTTRIEIYGKIDTNEHQSQNVGGVAGATNIASFYGTFVSSADLSAIVTDGTVAENVGGFIGAALNKTEILPGSASSDTVDVQIGGTIAGTNNVGGFIGDISPAGEMRIAPSTDNSGSSRLGVLNVSIVAGSNIRAYGNFAGGIIGNCSGAVEIGPRANLSNKGNVKGQRYVGGLIGFMALGTLGGMLENEGQVDGDSYVGGIIGVLAANARYATFANRNSVVSTSADVKNKMAIGGAIGYIGTPAALSSFTTVSNPVFEHNHIEYANSSGETLNLVITGGESDAANNYELAEQGAYWYNSNIGGYKTPVPGGYTGQKYSHVTHVVASGAGPYWYDTNPMGYVLVGAETNYERYVAGKYSPVAPIPDWYVGDTFAYGGYVVANRGDYWYDTNPAGYVLSISYDVPVTYNGHYFVQNGANYVQADRGRYYFDESQAYVTREQYLADRHVASIQSTTYYTYNEATGYTQVQSIALATHVRDDRYYGYVQITGIPENYGGSFYTTVGGRYVMNDHGRFYYDFVNEAYVETNLPANYTGDFYTPAAGGRYTEANQGDYWYNTGERGYVLYADEAAPASYAGNYFNLVGGVYVLANQGAYWLNTSTHTYVNSATTAAPGGYSGDYYDWSNEAFVVVYGDPVGGQYFDGKGYITPVSGPYWYNELPREYVLVSNEDEPIGYDGAHYNYIDNAYVVLWWYDSEHSRYVDSSLESAGNAYTGDFYVPDEKFIEDDIHGTYWYDSEEIGYTAISAQAPPADYAGNYYKEVSAGVYDVANRGDYWLNPSTGKYIYCGTQEPPADYAGSFYNLNTTTGGIGGVIGIVGSNVVWDRSNTFYIAGNVSAPSINNVGGTIGLIEASNVVIKDLIALDSTVTGAMNVGGVVGAVTGSNVTIENSFNITLTSTNVGVSNSVAAGGIVGKAANDTDAHTSYWFKGFENEELSSLSLEEFNSELGRRKAINAQIGTSNTSCILTKEVFASYETPEDYATAKGITLTSAESAVKENWADFLELAKFAQTGYTIRSYDETVVTPGGEEEVAYTWYVYEYNNFTPYTTGTARTGWYFAYSTLNNLIETIYGSVDNNLAYWRYIANNYPAGQSRETSPIKDTPSAIIPKAVDGVYQYAGGGIISDNIGKLHARASGASAGYYLYIAATNEEGLARIATENSGDLHMFVQADTATAGNVAIYYRNVSAGDPLVYNGLARYAPLSAGDGLDVARGEIKYIRHYADNITDENIASSLGFETIDELDGKYVYTATIPEGTVNGAVVPGNYTSDITIYYASKEGDNLKLYNVGSFDDMSWKIEKRTLSLSIKAQSGDYADPKAYQGGKKTNNLEYTTGNMPNTLTVEITGVVAQDNKASAFAQFELTLNNVTSSKASPVYVASFATSNGSRALGDGSQLGLNCDDVVLVTYKDASSTTPYFKSQAMSDNIDHTASGTPQEVTYRFVFRYKDVYESGYTISVRMVDDGTSTNVSDECYVLGAPQPNDTLRINKKTLNVKVTSGNRKVYNGTASQSIVEISTFNNIGNEIQTTLYNLGLSLDGTTTIPFNNIASGSQTTSAGFTVKPVYAQKTLLTIGGIKDMGTYYLWFDRNAYNNYDINTTTNSGNNAYWTQDGGKYKLLLYTITPNEMYITVGQNTKSSHTFDRTKGDAKVTVSFKQPFTGDVADAVAKLIAISCNGTNLSWTTDATASGSAYIFKTTSVDAATYTFTLSAKAQDGDNAQLLLNLTPNITNASYDYTISPKRLNVSISQPAVTHYYTGYDQRDQAILTITAASGGDVTQTSEGSPQFTYKGETETINFSILKGGSPTNYLVDVGTYSINAAAPNSNYIVTASASSYVIAKAPVTIANWSKANGGSYIYNATDQHPHVSSLTINGGSYSCSGTTNSAQYASPSAKVVLTVELREAGASGAISGGKTINVGSYQAVVTAVSVSGNNAGGAEKKSNYDFGTDDSNIVGQILSYSITPCIISASLSGTVTKTYDGNRTASATGVTVTPTKVSEVTISSLPANCVVINGNGTYASANVGTHTVTYTVDIADSNFAFGGNALSTTLTISGTITQKQVRIILNTRGANGGKEASKSYDDTTDYGIWRAGTGVPAESIVMLGKGVSVVIDDLVAADRTDEKFALEVKFAEADTSRSAFDAFVNDIISSSGGYIFNPDENNKYYKKLVFTVGSYSGSTFTANGGSAKNYKYMVCANTSGTQLLSAAKTSYSFDVYDSDDSRAAGNGQSSNKISIVIMQNSFDAKYTHTKQSYVNADYSFKTSWQDVDASNKSQLASGVTINFVNNWKYVDNNPSNPQRMYKAHTVIHGEEGSNVLSASLTSSNGKHLNYILRNQPTLTIGYFVSTGDEYEVGSISGLMLATYYYSRNFVENDGSGIGSALYENQWHMLITNAQYSGSSYTSALPYTSKLDGYNPASFASWDAHFEWIEAAYQEQLGKEIKIIRDTIQVSDSTTEVQWGFWMQESLGKASYEKFIQVKNISGVLTANDVAVLEGIVSEGTGNWNDYFPNFLQLSAGNVVTAIGSIFANNTYMDEDTPVSVAFIGSYNGKGFTIENVNIMGYATLATATTYNVGMFESVGSGSYKKGGATKNGVVTSVNLRNWNIVFSDGNSIAGNTLNVGGVVGLSQQTTPLKDSTFHGIINVYSGAGTVNVGGLIGKYDTTGVTLNSDTAIIDGAIAIGNIYAKAGTINAGGIIGNLYAASSTSFTVNNVVSMTGIFATASTNVIGGLIGRSSNANALTTSNSKENAYVTDSVVDMTAGNAVNKQIGNGSNVAGVTYTTLRAGSESGYVGGNAFVGPETTTAKKYDMVEPAFGATNVIESHRVVDIIDIYVLLYAKGTTTTTVSDKSVTAFTKGSTSWMVGTALGTTASPITINNQQQVAYLREFRFATFTLARDIDMYTAYNVDKFAGAFYGTVNANNHTINTKNSPTAYMFELILDGHSLPVVKD